MQLSICFIYNYVDQTPLKLTWSYPWMDAVYFCVQVTQLSVWLQLPMMMT